MLEGSSMRPICTHGFPEPLGRIRVPALSAPTNHNRRSGSNNAEFDLIEPQWTRLASRAVPNEPRLYPRLPLTIEEHLSCGPPRIWEHLKWTSVQTFCVPHGTHQFDDEAPCTVHTPVYTTFLNWGKKVLVSSSYFTASENCTTRLTDESLCSTDFTGQR
jgi:hypothetical protein